jgi:hypothetical protein
VALDSFDLKLQNADILDHKQLKTLYKTFLSGKFTEKRFAKDIPFDQYLRNDLGRWIDMPQDPLTSRVYVTLSNWFLSIGAFTPKPPKPQSAEILANSPIKKHFFSDL